MNISEDVTQYRCDEMKYALLFPINQFMYNFEQPLGVFSSLRSYLLLKGYKKVKILFRFYLVLE